MTFVAKIQAKMNALPTLPEFEFDSADTTNVGLKWQKWVLRFENFTVAYDINADPRKKALLLHFAGPIVHDIYETLSPDTIGDNYADTLKVLNDYFLPKKNVEFRQIKQEVNESLDTYYTKLKQLAKYCEFDNIEKEIKSQIIQSCLSNKVRRKALRDSDVCSPAVTVLLPTVDDCNERTTKKGRRKGSKGKNDENWRYCVQNCLHSGKSPNELIQCHLCQSWIHPECVGEDSKDIVGIWTCTTCRQLPVLVARLVEKTSALETLIEKLTCSNQQLVALVVEQQQDLRKISENISIPTTTTDTTDPPPKVETLLVGNSLLRDVHFNGYKPDTGRQ